MRACVSSLRANNTAQEVCQDKGQTAGLSLASASDFSEQSPVNWEKQNLRVAGESRGSVGKGNYRPGCLFPENHGHVALAGECC